MFSSDELQVCAICMVIMILSTSCLWNEWIPHPKWGFYKQLISIFAISHSNKVCTIYFFGQKPDLTGAWWADGSCESTEREPFLTMNSFLPTIPVAILLANFSQARTIEQTIWGER